MAEPAIRKAITVLDMLSRDPETVRLAELRRKQILDERSMLEGAREEGIKEGIKEGLKEGENKKAYEIAINLLSMGMDIPAIVKATGLTEEDINKINNI